MLRPTGRGKPLGWRGPPDGTGRRRRARELLAPFYTWFTAGFDTPDLQDAKALLDELG
jgi:hypothetical protein